MKSKIWTEMIIDGFEIKPEELTKLIGVQPSSTANKGDKYHTPNGKIITVPFNEWILKSGCSTSINLEKQMKVLISKLKPFKKDFLEFCKKHSPDFNIVMHIFSGESPPPIVFENSDIIKDMALLNASFGIDYSFYEDEKDL